MRCDEVQERLEELGAESLPGDLREHLEVCAACQLFARQYRSLQAGFRVWAAEAVPEPSWGFAERLLRRWDEAQAQDHSMEVFFEQAGRRFIFGMLALTLILLMALVLPPSSPMRGVSSADLLAASPETVSVRTDPILGEGQQDSQDATVVSPDAGEVKNSK